MVAPSGNKQPVTPDRAVADPLAPLSSAVMPLKARRVDWSQKFEQSLRDARQAAAEGKVHFAEIACDKVRHRAAFAGKSIIPELIDELKETPRMARRAAIPNELEKARWHAERG